jgi:tetratricopeptide (TPR) repeat protein
MPSRVTPLHCRSFLRALLLALATLVLMTAHAADPALSQFSATLDQRWDYGKPDVSEARFRAEFAKLPPDDARALIVVTQIARTQSLRRQYAEANATLDAIEAKLATAPSLVRVRYLLERGRTFDSSGAPERAVPLFSEALAIAERDGDAFYAVDAAHMLGIAAAPAARLDWNLKALALAENATDPRAQRWDASLYNNIGWTYHDRGEYATALTYWEKGLVARKARGDASATRVAQWTVARGLRSVGRLDEAQAMQQALAKALDAIGEPDGYVYEELAEIAMARNDPAAAKPWAQKAHAALKDDPGLAREPRRLARLAEIAAGSTPATKAAP